MKINLFRKLNVECRGAPSDSLKANQSIAE